MSAVQFIVKSIQDMSQADREAVFAAFAMDPPMASPVAAGASTSVAAPAKVEKKPRANAGKPSCHGAWTKHVLDRFSKDSAEQKEFLAARIVSAERGEMLYTKDMAKVKSGKKQVGDTMDAKDAAVGAHMAFVGWWAEQHQAEHAAFKAAWELEHPKGAAKAAGGTAENSDDAATVADEDDTAAPSAAVGGAGSAAAPVAKPEAKKRGPKKMADMTPEELAAAKAKRAENKAKKTSANNSAEGSRASSPPKVKGD